MARVPDAASTEQQFRTFDLERIAGGFFSKRLVVHEPVSSSLDPEDLEYRIRCLEFSDHEPWTWVDASREGDVLRVDFPDDEYDGYPPYVGLQMPRKPQIGQHWRLVRNDGAPLGTYLLKSIETVLHKGNDWQHGDIVSAAFEGSPYVARFIRKTEDGLALVHWSHDGLFSEISMDDIWATSHQRWTRELADEDTEIES